MGGGTLWTLAVALAVLAAAVAALDVGEEKALLAMRAAWGMSAPENWVGPPNCTWTGIDCGGGAHVIGLLLSGYGLVGIIPPEIGLLQELIFLDLSMNPFTGSIPRELGNLRQLQHLFLDANQLIGSIPSELGNLSQLQELDLSTNQLSGSIPPELGNLSQLKNLWLYSNQLTGSIPPELGYLSQMHWLFLSSNQLTGSIPPELGNLSQLQNLDLSTNQLTGLIPTMLGRLSQLQLLFLFSNQLHGPIPSELENLRSIYLLFLYSNNLSGNIPSSLSKLITLQFLDLHSNYLSGTIPSEILELPNIAFLDLSFNNLSGSLPSANSIFSLFDISNNYMNGEIPLEIGDCTNLMSLDLSNNSFSGSLPDLSRLGFLLYANFSHSGLSGSFPMSLSLLPDLTTLDLSGYILDSIPHFNDSSLFPSLFTFAIADAQLGSMAFLCTMASKLGELSVANNFISAVDRCIMNMLTLKSLDLSGNPIVILDVVPVELLEIDLQNCGLGKVPDAIAALSWRTIAGGADFSSSVFSPLLHLDLSFNPISPQVGFFQASCIPEHSSSWACGGYSEGYLSSFPFLESLRFVDTTSTWIPPQWLSNSLSTLLVSKSGSINLAPLLVQGYLTNEDNSPNFFDDLHYQCDSLSLTHSTTSIVKFDPIQYDFQYCRCMAGYFGAVPTRLSPSVSHCRPCIDVTVGGNGDGIECHAATSELGVLSGYFPQWSSYSADSLNVSQDGNELWMALPCPNLDACEPRVEGCKYATRTGQLQCDEQPAGDEWWMCAEGYWDRLCSQCEDEFFRSGPTECERCTSHLSFLSSLAASNWLLLPVGVLIALAIVFFIVLQGFGVFALVAEAAVVGLLVFVAVGEGWLLTVMLLLLLLYTVVEAEAAEALVKSLLFFLQTLAVLAPENMLALVKHVPLSTFNFHPVGVDCAPALRVLQQPEWHTGMMLVLPVVLVVLAAFVVACGFFFKRIPLIRRAIARWDSMRTRLLAPRAVVRAITVQLGVEAEVHRLLDIEDDERRDAVEPSADEGEHHHEHADNLWLAVLAQIVHTSLFILYAVYFDVAGSVLQAFATCDPNDRNFMAPPYSWVPCIWTSMTLTPVAVVGLIGLVVYVIGVPVLFTALLVAGHRLGKHASVRWFGFLFEGYRDGAAYYYELLYLARRLLLAAALALVPEEYLLRPQLVSAILALSIIVHLYVQPYERAVENVLEIVSLSVLMVTFSTNIAQESDGSDAWENQLALALLLGMNVLVVCAFLGALGWPYISALLRAGRRLLRLPEPVLRRSAADDLHAQIVILQMDKARLQEENAQLRHRYI